MTLLVDVHCKVRSWENYDRSSEDIKNTTVLTQLQGEVIVPMMWAIICRDPKYKMLLVAVIIDIADAIVIGDHDLLEVNTLERIPTITPQSSLPDLFKGVFFI